MSQEFEIIEATVTNSSKEGPGALPKLKRQVDGFTRGDVVNAFARAFDMIGGVQRLALWANANPDKFYPLYSKLLPSTNVVLGAGSALQVIHAIPPTALDNHPGEGLTIVPIQEIEDAQAVPVSSPQSGHDAGSGEE